MGKIFISHSSRDEIIVEAFCDHILIGALSINHADIFCTSIDGMRIRSGYDWRNEIKAELSAARVVLLIVSPAYRESEVCLNEMGAAWISDIHVLPIIVPPISTDTVGVLAKPLQYEKINDEGGLDRIRDEFVSWKLTSDSKVKSDRWTAQKKKFLVAYEKQIKANPYPPSIERSTVEELTRKLSESEAANTTLVEDLSRCEDQIARLKLAKNADEIAAIEREFSDSSEMERFQDLLRSTTDALEEFHPSVRTLLYNYLTDNSLEIDLQGYSSQLQEAVARKILEDEYTVNTTHRSVRNATESFANLRHFIFEECTEQFTEQFVTEYGIDDDPDILDFWERVLKVKLAHE